MFCDHYGTYCWHLLQMTPFRDNSQPDVLKAIAYSLDTLIPGLYIWMGRVKFRIGGSQPEENYSGVIYSNDGCAIVLPGYRIYST